MNNFIMVDEGFCLSEIANFIAKGIALRAPPVR